MNSQVRYRILTAAFVLVLAALPARAAEATFHRTLSVSGQVTLHVSTGSGSIRITTGSGNEIRVIGHVRASHGWGDGGGNPEDRVRQVAANPPIEQTGGIVRIGAHLEGLHNVSIDYEIEAPSKVYLDANSGSGDVTDDGVGVNARLNTGSGSIHAKGLSESFTVETGSGDIYAEQVGAGDVKAHTGSGTIELRNLNGGLRAETGSGDIHLTGRPAADWRIKTGSGSVDLTPGSAAFDLEASTGSGTIHTDHEMQVVGSQEKHHMTGKVNGGGPAVRVETGSGDVRIH